MTWQRIRIQNKLVDLVLDASFPVVKYDQDGRASVKQESGQDVLSPVASPVVCNEVGSSFEEDENHGRSLKTVRSGWSFVLRLQFNSEVILEDFEETLSDSPPTIPLDEEKGLPFVRLFLVGAEAEHPVQHDGNTGTKVEYTFLAEQGRR